MAGRLGPLVFSALGFSAVFPAGPVGTAAAAERVGYDAGVRVSGQLVVSFHGDPAGCASFFRCDVQSGSVKWTPRSGGRLSLFGITGRRLNGYMAPSSPPGTRPETVTIVQRGAPTGRTSARTLARVPLTPSASSRSACGA